MTALQETSSAPTAQRPAAESWWRLPEIWGTLAIVTMWLAVLFVGLYAGDMRFTDAANGNSSVPSGVAVAICAAFATASVAKRAFRS